MQEPKSLYPLKIAHLRAYLSGLQALRVERDQLDVLLRNATPAQAEKFRGMTNAWGALYELPLFDLLARIMRIAEQEQAMTDALTSATPIDSMIKASEELYEGPSEQPSPADAANMVGLTYVGNKNIDCILVYGQSLHSLILAVKKGNPDAFFKAVSIDPSAISAPTLAKRLNEAQQMREKRFLEKMQKALNGPSQHIKTKYDELRLILALLREGGVLPRMSVEDRYQVLAVELNLYPSEDGQARSLNQFIYNWEKSLST